MGKAIDLNVYEESTFDLTLRKREGETTARVLHIRKPSEETLLRIMQMERIIKSGDNEKLLSELAEFIRSVLANNKEGVDITHEFMKAEGLDFGTQMVVFKAYAEFTQEILSDPNLPSPPEA